VNGTQSLSLPRSLWNGLLKQAGQLVLPLLSIAVALLIGAILMLAIGIDPVRAYAALWSGVASSRYQIGITLVKATPLLLTGLGLGFAFRSGVFNIGGEGQIYMGALFGTAVGLQHWGLPPLIHIPLALLAGFIGGGLWGAIPGYLKARLQVNEVITTILLNYIAILTVSYFTHGPLKEDQTSAAALPHTAEVLLTSRLPLIWPGTRLHLGFLIALAAAAVMWFVMFRTTFGFRARAVGRSLPAARYAGMRVVRVITLVMVVSGGLAGMAGTVEVLGVQRRLRDSFSVGTGYTAIAIALLGQNNPIGIVLASILFGALEAGVSQMEALAGVPSTIVEIIQAVIIFLVALSVAWRSETFTSWLRRAAAALGLRGAVWKQR
jgi:general nucleoside transport system permease protein